jgi:hypothetical protein
MAWWGVAEAAFCGIRDARAALTTLRTLMHINAALPVWPKMNA